MSWLTNQVFAKQIDALKSGLDYFADAFKLTVWAITKFNIPALEDIVAIGETWFKEALDETGNIGLHVVQTLVSGGDPFEGSRVLLKAAIAKYGVDGFSVGTTTPVTKAVSVANPVSTVSQTVPVTEEITHETITVPGQLGSGNAVIGLRISKASHRD